MIRVSAAAFDVLWADLGFGPTPGPLTVRSAGTTWDERDGIRAAVYENLSERGLFDGSALDPGLEAKLDVLASATVYVECEALADLTAETSFRAVAASRGGRAVLAVQPEQTIGLSDIGESEVFSAMVDVLPELEAGPGYGVSLPAAALGDVEDPLYAGTSARSASYERQVREVLAIQARPVHSAGQFTVRVREPGGKLRRAGGVSWFSTDIGTYSGTVQPGRGGDWVSVTPADATRLTARLSALLDPS